MSQAFEDSHDCAAIEEELAYMRDALRTCLDALDLATALRERDEAREHIAHLEALAGSESCAGYLLRAERAERDLAEALEALEGLALSHHSIGGATHPKDFGLCERRACSMARAALARLRTPRGEGKP